MRHLGRLPSVAVVAGALFLTACDGPTDEPPPEDANGSGGDEVAADEGPPPDEVAAEPQPAWAAPSPTSIGAPLAIEPAVARTDEVAVALDGVVAHDEGVELWVTVREHPDRAAEDAAQGPPEPGGPFDPGADWIESGEDELPDDILVVTVTLPDGQTVSTADEFTDPPEPDQEPDGPILTAPIGSGDASGWDQLLWLWPDVAADGTIEVELGWPDEGIDETVEIAADEVDAASERAVQLWDDEEVAGSPDG